LKECVVVSSSVVGNLLHFSKEFLLNVYGSRRATERFEQLLLTQSYFKFCSSSIFIKRPHNWTLKSSRLSPFTDWQILKRFLVFLSDKVLCCSRVYPGFCSMCVCVRGQKLHQNLFISIFVSFLWVGHIFWWGKET